MDVPAVHGEPPPPAAAAALLTRASRTCCVQAYVLTERALGDALAESMAGDMSIVAVGIVAMFAFTYSVLTRRLDAVRSRLALTAVGALAVLLGAAGALGLVSAFEVPVTDLNQVLLYVTLGIGVDGESYPSPLRSPRALYARSAQHTTWWLLDTLCAGPQTRLSSPAALTPPCTRRVRRPGGDGCQR